MADRRSLQMMTSFSNKPAHLMHYAAQYCVIFRAALDIRAGLTCAKGGFPDMKLVAEDAFRRHGVLPPAPVKALCSESDSSDGMRPEDCLALAQAELNCAAAQLNRDIRSAKAGRYRDNLLRARHHACAALEAVQQLPALAKG